MLVANPVPLKPHEKANLAYRLCFGHLPDAELTFTESDDNDSCDLATLTYFNILYARPNRHWLKQDYPSTFELLLWFDTKYPTIH